MNRRSFLSRAGMATVTVGVPSLVTTKKSWGQTTSSNVDRYTQGTSAACSTTAYATYNYASSSHYATLIATLTSIKQDWVNAGNDAVLSPLWNRVNPDSVHSSALDLQRILSMMQVYQPQFSMADLLQAYGRLDQASAAQKAQASQMASQSGLVAAHLAPSITSLEKLYFDLHQAELASQQTGTMAVSRDFQPDAGSMPQRPPQHLPGGGKSQYNCQTDGAILFFAGLAFGTLSVMSFGAAPVLAGAAWAAVSFWGGTAVTAYSVGHVLDCGF